MADTPTRLMEGHLPDFDLLYQGASADIYLIDKAEGLLAKVLKKADPEPEDRQRLQNEVEVSKAFAWKRQRKVFELKEIDGRPALIMEHLPGQSWRSLFQGGTLDVETFLERAVQAASAIHHFHTAGLIHRQLNPDHFIYAPDQQSVSLISSGAAIPLDKLGEEDQSLDFLLRQENLPYIAPELTGRTDQIASFQSDLYSLGAIFYEALGGVPPFMADSPLQYLHAHIARTPLSLHESTPDIPKVLSDMVLRLLEKEQERRFPSAEALCKDLKECLEQWRATGQLKEGPPTLTGQRFRKIMANKLYNRDRELAFLRSHFQRAFNGEVQCILVAGTPGVGKSALCHGFKGEVRELGGTFIQGKQNPYQLDIPYHPLVQAIDQFVTQLLTQDEEIIESWKARIQRELRNIGGVLTEIVPNLALIIGEQAPMPNLQGPELKNRLQRAFRHFFRALAQANQPLVMLIEDLQWSDLNTLGVLESLLADHQISNFLLLITTRSEIYEPEHPLNQKLQVIKQSFEQISELEVVNLTEPDIRKILADAFHSEIVQAGQLASKIMDKTKGNPLYTTELILAIIQEKLINYQPGSSEWTWDSGEIEKLLLPDGSFEIMASRVHRLDPKSQQILATAACIGHRFSLSLLSGLHDHAEAHILSYLYALERNGLVQAQTGFVAYMKEVFQFTHDEVQKAAYHLLSEEEKRNRHLSIGKALLNNLSDEDLEDRIFDVVIQLNNSSQEGQSPEFCLQLAELNFKAGKKAKESAAFNPAYYYVKQGIRWLGAQKWENHYDLSLALHNEALSLASLTGYYEELERWYREVLDNSRSLLDQEIAYRSKIYAFTAEKKLAQAVDCGLQYLKQLKYRIPKKPGKLFLVAEILRTNLKLRNYTIERLTALKENTDPETLSAVRVMRDTSVAAYFVQPNLNALLLLRTVHLTLKHGNSPGAAFAYGGVGFILSGILGAFQRGHKFGELSITIAEQLGRKDIKYYQSFIHNIFLRHWVEHTRHTLPSLKEVHRELLDLGNFEFGAYAAHSYIYFSFFLGNDLVKLEQEAAAYANSLKLLNQPITLQRINMYWQAIQNLLGNYSTEPEELKGEIYDEDGLIPVHHEDKVIIALHNVYFLKSFLCYLFEDHSQALAYAKQTDEFAEGAVSSFFVPLKTFFDGLILLANPSAPRRWSRVRSHLKKMKKYSQAAPDNFLGQYYLMKAEYHRCRNQEEKARTFYERAVQEAQDKDQFLTETLAWELGGKFYVQQENRSLASLYLQNAYKSHLKWGALAKARQLENRYGPYLQHSFGVLQDSVVESRKASLDAIDLITLVKTLRILSTELDVSRLFNKMMTVAIQNAGAESGLLALETNGQWEIVAKHDINKNEAKVLQGQYLFSGNKEEQEGSHPVGLLQYVINTEELLAINDVRKDERFNEIPYLRERGVQSLLCLPLIKQNRLVGLLYLENTLTTGAFTKRIQEGLSLISGHLATAVQNALLYEDLEDQVVENKKLLSDLKAKVEEQERTLKLFTQYVPEPVVKKALESKEVSVWEGELRDVTVMFCDIRGFTEMSEELQPNEVVELLNHYYSRMTDIILKYNGSVNKFIGDEVFSLFGAPDPNPRKEINATLCALEMIEAIPELNEKYFNKYGKNLVVGIGIHGGQVVAGNLGSKTKLSYSVTGDIVNTGKRIESLTKGKGNAILISEYVYQRCQEQIEASAWQPMPVKGKKNHIQVYEVLGRKG